MNRCAICGKFRPWGVLTFRWATYLAGIDGDVVEDEWFECAVCRPDPKGGKR